MGFRIRGVDPLYTQPETIRVEFTYNHWVSALWDAIMGDQTLADVVAGIFTGVSTALQRVKDGLNSAWNGIKSAGQFVTHVVMRTILGSISLLSNLLLTGLFSVADLLTPLSVDLSGSVPALVIGSQKYSFGIDFTSDVLSLYIGNLRLSIDNIFSPSEITAETLYVNSVGFWTFSLLSEVTGFLPLVLMKKFLDNPATVKEGITWMSITAVSNLLLLTTAYGFLTAADDPDSPEDREEIAEVLSYYSYYHYIMMITMFGFILDNLMNLNNYPKGLGILSVVLAALLGITDNYFDLFFTIITGKSISLNENVLNVIKILSLLVGGMKSFLIEGLTSKEKSYAHDKENMVENIMKAKSGIEKASSYKTVQNLKVASERLRMAADALDNIPSQLSDFPDTKTLQDLYSRLTMYIFLAVQSLITSVVFAKLAGGYI